jgi:hypothetical protein
MANATVFSFSVLEQWRPYKIKLTANSCIALCSFKNAVRFSSARTMERLFRIDFISLFSGLSWACTTNARSGSHAQWIEPTDEIVPSKGRENVPVLRLICPSRLKMPLAPAKRPVPPVTKALSVLSNTPGTSVGVKLPTKGPEILSPLAAVKT